MTAGAARRDRRIRSLVLATLCVVALGLLISAYPEFRALWSGPDSQRGGAETRPVEQRPETADGSGVDYKLHAEKAMAARMAEHFAQALKMIEADEYEDALVALQRVLAIRPTLVEANVNMGFVLFALGRYDSARDFFEAAIALRPGQANAYYGLAECHEQLGDLGQASAAMRTYIHLSAPDDPFVVKARAALWEWESGTTVVADDSADTERRPQGGAGLVPPASD